MKQHLVKGFLVLSLLSPLWGVMLCKGQPVQAEPGDSGDEEEAEKTKDTEDLEQKRQNALDQIKSIK